MLKGNNKYPFTEKYRPNCWGDLVYKDKWKLKKNFELNRITHLLVYSESGGTGKGSIANIIKNQYEQTFLEINCGIDNGKDYLSKRIVDIPSIINWYSGRRKVLFIDEVNKLSPEAFETLKVPLEKYAHICMVIIATNNIKKIPQPVLSRFYKIDLSNPDKDMILERLKYICEEENVQYNEDILRNIIKDYYPSIREMITHIQVNQDYLCEEVVKSNLLTKKQVNYIWRGFIQVRKIIPLLNHCQKNKLNYYDVIKSLESATRIRNVAGDKTNDIQRLIVDYKNKIINEQNSDNLMEEFLHKFDKILSKK